MHRGCFGKWPSLTQHPTAIPKHPTVTSKPCSHRHQCSLHKTPQVHEVPRPKSSWVPSPHPPQEQRHPQGHSSAHHSSTHGAVNSKSRQRPQRVPASSCSSANLYGIREQSDDPEGGQAAQHNCRWHESGSRFWKR